MKTVNVTCEHEKETLKIKITGDIDHHTAKPIREEIDKKIYLFHAQSVVFDLSEVEFMDSSGLGLILGRYAKIHELGGSVKVVNPTEAALKILLLAGVEKLITIEKKEK